MPYEQLIAIGRETLYSTVLTVLPVLIAALIAGLLIGILQAATSINETTLAFVPKLLIVGIVLALSAPFMISTLTSYFQTIFIEVSKVNR
ncbi:MAG: flagellar biosynthetic protein FliQ [Alphaproteobacteria bacterium]|nr:flagellar biosynthetic protein FliQ [Alphaproteobacteria bacterium]